MECFASIDAAVHAASDPSVVMHRVTKETLQLVPESDGAAILLKDSDTMTLTCALGSMAPHSGRSFNGDAGGLPALSIERRETLYCGDARRNEHAHRAFCKQAGIASVICVPLRRRDEIYGVLTVTASRPDAFGPPDIELLTLLGEFASTILSNMIDISDVAKRLLAAIPYAEQPSHLPNSETTDIAVRRFLANVLDPGASDAVATRARIHHVLATAGFSFAGQPIVSLNSGQVFAVESLARFPGEPPLSPDIWFDQAASIGLGVEFDLGAFAAALKLLDKLPPLCQLSINLGPQALSSPHLPRLLRASQPGRIIIELTEHMVIHDYPQLRRSVEHIRGLGAQLAIDDTGAGFASLAHIVNLAPDLIKLDRGLTRGVNSDPARRAVAQSLVSLARDIGAHVVAEGIETEEELGVVRDLGISYAQGYLLGRPSHIAELQWSFPEVTESGRAEPTADKYGQIGLPPQACPQPAVSRWYAHLGRSA